MSTWTSNLSQFYRDDSEAQQDGLVAAAYVLVNAVKRGLKGGYKSGDFVTGNVINSVTRSQPMRDGLGYSISVGTNIGADGSSPAYPLYWELGHFNAFTRRYEREERWRPAFMDSRGDMQAAYSRQWKRTMKRWEA